MSAHPHKRFDTLALLNANGEMKDVTRRVTTCFLLTSLLGIGYEVLVVRVLSQVAEDTVYTFAMLLAIYLVGSAIGAAVYQRWLSQHQDADGLTSRLLSALAVTCLLGTASLWFAEHIKAAALTQLGSSMNAALGAEALLALFAFGLPTMAMGMMFSHLSTRATLSGISFGRALSINTVGAAAAPLLFGVLALPLLGAKLSLLLISAGYVLLAIAATSSSKIRKRMSYIWLPVSAIAALAIWAPPLAFIDIPEGGHVISYQEGVMAAVSVVEDAQGVSRLRIDNRQQEGSSSSLRVDSRQALLPLLLHPNPKRALFLGLGTGVTASSAAQYPGIEVDAVELLPEVIGASAYFTQVFAEDAGTAHLHLLAADARRYVRASPQQYDVIVADNFHPARSGSGSLYTVEHFTAVRERMNTHGLFCQWLPLHQLDLHTLRSIVQSFMAAYPNGKAILASNSLETPVLGLIGHRDVEHFNLYWLHDHLAGVALPEPLANVGIEDEFSLLGSFIAGSQSLREFAGDAVLNTDDHPIVTYNAPRITYAPDSLPRDRLLSLLEMLSIKPDELIDTNADTSASRLAAYWTARNLFIASGRDIQPSADVRAMLAQVREPLLSVLHISPDFRPAYDPLLRMAYALTNTDVVEARLIFGKLVDVQPARPEAVRALHELNDLPHY